MAPDTCTMYFHGGAVTVLMSSASGNGTAGRTGTEGWNSNICNFADYTRFVDTGDDGESPFEKWMRWWTGRQKSIDSILERARAYKPLAKAVQFVRHRFERRSEPRWSSLRWKAKT